MSPSQFPFPKSLIFTTKVKGKGALSPDFILIRLLGSVLSLTNGITAAF